MKKYMKKAVLFTLLLSIVVLCGLLCSCVKEKEEYVEDRFTVFIGADYEKAFSEKEFTVEDFESEYIERIDYAVWCAEQKTGVIYIQLKSQDKNHLDEVMRQVDNLPFVTSVEKIGIIHLDSVY